MSWFLPFLDVIQFLKLRGIPNFHRSIVINYGDRAIAPILLLPNYILTFALKGDLKGTGGGCDMANATVDFFAAGLLSVPYNVALYPKWNLLSSSVKFDVQFILNG